MRVDVYTCGVTASDILICQGVYDVQPKLPFTPGFEAFWEVKEVASDVVSVRHGERVIGLKKKSTRDLQKNLSSDMSSYSKISGLYHRP